MADFVYTIGHSTHSTEKLIELLVEHGVTAIADVRSRPYSRINPQFNRETLRADLKVAGITYLFLGLELGARPDDRSCYVEGKVQYDLIARTDLFQAGLTQLAQGLRSHRISLMCAEKDPLACHRAILVCRHLAGMGIGAKHIIEDGRLESHDNAITRLLSELGIVEYDLFRSRDQLIDEAYSRRAQQIAFTETASSAEAPVLRIHR